MSSGKAFVTAIVLAAGSGTRMGSETTKQKISLLGESILSRTLRAFSECDGVDAIVVVCKDDEKEWVRAETENKIDKITSIISGGNSRAESARIGFANIPPETDYVAIHDGARCLITPENINSVIKKSLESGAATAAVKATDTVKLCNGGCIVRTLPRDEVFLASTPQIFSRELYQRALNNSSLDGVTDDNMLVESIGVEISVVDIGKENIKITTPDDIEFAEYIIKRRSRMDEIRVGHGYDVHRFAEERKLVLGGVEISVVDIGKENIKITTPEDIEFAEYIIKRRSRMDEIRVGHGYDVHRFAEGRKLTLGGVEISCDIGLLGHSDADVLLHAIMDAMLGACGLGDIGRHFPDNDENYKGISSLVLLRKTSELVGALGYTVNNVDATVVMQSPKIAPYISQMVSNIAEILGIESGRVNVKATTEEKLGFTGRLEGVSAHAVVTIKNKG